MAALRAQGLLEIAPGWEEGGPEVQAAPRGGRYFFSRHNPVWAYCDPRLQYPYDGALATVPIFDTLQPPLQLTDVIQKTRYLVLLGCDSGPDFRHLLALPQVLKLAFEPSVPHFLNFIAETDQEMLVRQNAAFIVGARSQLARPLADYLDPDVGRLGFPVFLIQEGLPTRHGRYLQDLIEYLEILYYRHKIYSIEGQAQQRGLPLRPLKRDLFFDQQWHFYENLSAYVTQHDIAPLEDAARGCTAILVGAGPELDKKVDYIRQNLDKAVVICVNNALKTLLAHDLEPHFVIINDTSRGAARAFTGLAPRRRAMLVAHCLSSTGGGIFPQVFFFGNHVPEVCGERPNLRLHGSVITTAWSLARFLGCGETVLVGVQLASEDPWHFTYTQDSIHGRRDDGEERPLIHKFPQLYPVPTASGKVFYTTLNMRDACLWLLDEIKRADMKVINTTEETILFGDQISIDESFCVEPQNIIDINSVLLKIQNNNNRLNKKEQIIIFIRSEIEFWKNVRLRSNNILKNISDYITYIDYYIKEYDDNNVTYLLQRYRDFNYGLFNTLYYGSDDIDQKKQGVEYYCRYLTRMSHEFINLLRAQLRELIPCEAVLAEFVPGGVVSEGG